jgi:class 3 adenylate cyclase/CheY-like chemotaxis protein
LTIINAAYSNFVPKEFLRILNKTSITDVALGNLVKKDITILFSGIRGFTSIAEKIDSEEIFSLLNKYYTGVTSIIQKNKGFIDKFIGDEIVVLFPESAENAVRAAGEINRYLQEFNHSQSSLGKLNFKIGIGIHSGSVTLGTLGGKERMDTTVIGNAVGIAKKIETLTKSFSVPIIISSTTFSVLPDNFKLDSREIEHLRVGGSEGFITLYDYFGSEEPSKVDKIKSVASEYFRALTLYRGGYFTKAKDLFSNCQSQIPGDPIFSLHINRCNDKLLGIENNDPAANSNKPILALILSSNKETISNLEMILKKEKLDTITAMNERDGLSICKNMRPPLLFIDSENSNTKMQKLIESIRQDLNISTEECYIIAITKEDTPSNKSFLYDSGANDFILNPFQADAIKHIVGRMTSS